MLKILLIFALVYIVIKLAYRNRKPNNQTAPQQPESPTSSDSQSVEPLLSCPKCGTYFRQAQGYDHNGTIFCSSGCAKNA